MTDEFVGPSIAARRFIDLSVPIDAASWEPDRIRRQVIDHKKGGDLLGLSLILTKSSGPVSLFVNWILAKLGNGVSHKDFPGERGLSLMRYTLTTHTGTHIDAPFHYGDVNSEGLPARTVSELPLDWCYGDGVVLDVRASDDGGPVTKEEVQAALMRIGYQLKPNDIVLLRTGGDAAVGSKKYFMSFRGVTRDATAYIVEQGVRVIGVDSFGFDRPFADMLTDYAKSGDASNLWPAHLYGREREYCQLERLTNLGSISKPYGFTVSCFPVHLKRADAAWCRVVAMEESKESQCSK